MLDTDLLFAILNSYLRKYLQKWTRSKFFRNRLGKSIEFRFINAQRLFHENSDPETLFEPEKFDGRPELTHRTVDAMRDVARLISQTIFG